MSTQFDLVILGGGCAGLSLAIRLAELGNRCPRTLIIEQRTVYANDRTWCFWGDTNTPMQHLAKKKWQHVALQTPAAQVIMQCDATPYHMIPAAAFYNEAMATIERTSAIELVMGTSLSIPPRRVGGKWQLNASRGLCEADMVVDTRPGPGPKAGGATMWQSFYGHEIVCDHACFDPTYVGLMDFDTTDPARIFFTYTLPLSDRHALVEVTQFGPVPLPPEALETALRADIAKRVNGAAFRIERSEHGILPMGNHHKRHNCSSDIQSDPSYVYAGLMQGGARPATGYAFQRIQQWATTCADQLGRGQLPLSHRADPILLRAMDHLFLSVLRSHPSLAPALFLRLFDKVNNASLIRFLNDCATMSDYAAIIAALPAAPFLRQIPATLKRITLRYLKELNS